MALSANTYLLVFPTNGSDTNGGGYVAGSTGTDYTNQNGPQYSVTDGVSAGTTTITSLTASFGTDVVGNLIYVSGGTGSITAGWYQIISRTNATTIVVDRSTGLTAGTGVTLHIGGALKTIPVATSIAIFSNKIFVKAEATITTTATITLSTTGTPSNSVPRAMLIGFTSSLNDGGQVTIKLSTNTGLTGLNVTGAGWEVRNFIIDCNSLGTSKGINCAQNNYVYRNLLVKNFTSAGITAAGSAGTVDYCEVTAGTATSTAAIVNTGSGGVQMYRCNVHDNTCPGISLSGFSQVNDCIVTNNTGGSSDGIICSAAPLTIQKTTIHGNGRDGLRLSATNATSALNIHNNIFSSHTAGWGINFTNTAFAASPDWDGNVYYNNLSGTINNGSDTSTNPIDGIGAYVPSKDITCSVNPYTNSAGGDFTLNNTAGGGALIRGHGVVGALPGITQTGKEDMGVFQHADPASSVGTIGYASAG